MSLNNNYKLIKNKINLYNLNDFNHFVNTPSESNPTLKEYADDANTFGQYKTRIGTFAKQDLSRYGSKIPPTVR